MDPLIIGFLTMALLLVFILLGVHVAIALAITSLLGVWLAIGDFQASINILSTTAFQGIREYIFGVIPLFVLMGLLSNVAGASTELYQSFHVLLRRIRGGLGMATVGANAVFATITGVSVASAAVFSKVSLGPMTDLKYDKKFALGTIAGSSVLGMLIPPSLLFIIYGMLAEVSVGKLFIAGIIPGILLSFIFCLGIFVLSKLKPELVGGESSEGNGKWTREDLKTIFRPWPIGILVVLMLGGLYGGYFTPTEAGGVGAFGAFLIVILKKKLNKSILWKTLIETGYTSASVLLLLITAQMYSRMLSIGGILNTLDSFIQGLTVSSTLLILIFMLILLIMGMVLDSTSILLIAMPLMLPFVKAIGFDLIAFGVIAVIIIEMGLLTPPFGLVVYSMKSALGEKATIGEISRGAFPFIVMMGITALILLIFPELSTWLPNMMIELQ